MTQRPYQFCSSCNMHLPYTEAFFPAYKTSSGRTGLRRTCRDCLGKSREKKAREQGSIVETAISTQPNSVFALAQHA